MHKNNRFYTAHATIITTPRQGSMMGTESVGQSTDDEGTAVRQRGGEVIHVHDQAWMIQREI